MQIDSRPPASEYMHIFDMKRYFYDVNYLWVFEESHVACNLNIHCVLLPSKKKYFLMALHLDLPLLRGNGHVPDAIKGTITKGENFEVVSLRLKARNSGLLLSVHD